MFFFLFFSFQIYNADTLNFYLADICSCTKSSGVLNLIKFIFKSSPVICSLDIMSFKSRIQPNCARYTSRTIILSKTFIYWVL